jgi:hypothetical protein
MSIPPLHRTIREHKIALHDVQIQLKEMKRTIRQAARQFIESNFPSKKNESFFF